jgi:hypothetical protein
VRATELCSSTSCRGRQGLLLCWDQNRSVWPLGKRIYSSQVSTKAVVYSTPVCCILLLHDPYSVPQNWNRHTCELFCCCHCRFMQIYPVFMYYWCWKISVALLHWKDFRSSISACFIAHSWYSTHTRPQHQDKHKHNIQGMLLVSSTNHSYNVFILNVGLWRGFRRAGAEILTQQISPDFLGTYHT